MPVKEQTAVTLPPTLSIPSAPKSAKGPTQAQIEIAGSQYRAKVFVVTAIFLIAADCVSRFFRRDHRQYALAAIEGFLTTFAVFGIIPLYVLGYRQCAD